MIRFPLLVAALVGYLLGSLPFGWLIARLHGVNIFEVGSRSSGATNVGRAVGPTARNLVFVLDAGKGAAAAGWPHLVPSMIAGEDAAVLCVVSLAAALIGHSFSCFTRFRGGKGVATGAGGFLVLLPLPTLIAACVWLVIFTVWRFVSLASICSAIALPFGTWLVGGGPPFLIAVSSGVAAFVVIRHRTNISRLLAGTENRAGAKD